MITCPWCGTSYKEFQSSCGKCGAALPVPPETAQAAGQVCSERLLVPPPPAPRPVLRGLHTRLVNEDSDGMTGMALVIIGVFLTLFCFFELISSSSGFGMFGFLFLLIGLVVTGGGVWLVRVRRAEMWKVIEVLRTGEAVVGEIVEVRGNALGSMNKHQQWEITYKFKVNGGQRIYGKVITQNFPSTRLQPGCEVNVLYLPEEPSRSVLYPHP